MFPIFKAGDSIVTGDGKNIYALGNINGYVGFYLVANGIVIPKDKGYLVINSTNEAKAFIPLDGEATGIDMIANDAN